ncbi:hypothetical protein [Haloparvum sedimenti]|uniref:hypothetical protein n=1 Tax=Haloparvum sedimenti TaxID=1678448 RepID=UPI00071E8CF6|nr:hypothetical protein [Haloparvum sedimenti]
MPPSIRFDPPSVPTAALAAAFVAALFVCAAAVGGAAGVDSGNGVLFDQDQYRLADGDVTEIGVQTPTDSDRRNVTIHPVVDGDAAEEPVATLRLRAAREGEDARFRIDTYENGTDAFVGVGATEVDATIHGNASLDAGTYELHTPGSWPARLTIGEPRVEDVSVYRAPAAWADGPSAVGDGALDEFATARENGTLVAQSATAEERIADAEGPWVAYDEALVVVVEADGLDATARYGEGETVRERLGARLGRTGSVDGDGANRSAALRIDQDPVSIGPSLPVNHVTPFDANATGRVLASPANGTYVVAVDLSDPAAFGDHEDDLLRDSTSLYNVRLGLGCEEAEQWDACAGAGNATYHAGPGTASNVTVERAADGEEVFVRGDTTLPPWETVTVAAGDATAEADVALPPSGVAGFSVSITPDADAEEVVVSHDGERLASQRLEADGETTAVTDDARATTTTPAGTEPGTSGDDAPGFGVGVAVAAVLVTAGVAIARKP